MCTSASVETCMRSTLAALSRRSAPPCVSPRPMHSRDRKRRTMLAKCVEETAAFATPPRIQTLWGLDESCSQRANLGIRRCGGTVAAPKGGRMEVSASDCLSMWQGICKVQGQKARKPQVQRTVKKERLGQTNLCKAETQN